MNTLGQKNNTNILRFVPMPLAAALPAGERAEATEECLSDPSATSFQARKAILVDELRHFLRRKNALMKEAERQFINELKFSTALLAPQSGMSENEKVGRLAVIGERASALERLKSRLHFLSEQKIQETKDCLWLLYNEPLDFPDAHTLSSSCTPKSSEKQDMARGSLLAWLIDDEVVASSVTYIDLTNAFDHCYENISIDMN